MEQVRADGQVKVDRVDMLLDTADLATKFCDAARRKHLIGMLYLREHETRLERMVDGRSAKDVSQSRWGRWLGWVASRQEKLGGCGQEAC